MNTRGVHRMNIASSTVSQQAPQSVPQRRPQNPEADPPGFRIPSPVAVSAEGADSFEYEASPFPSPLASLSSSPSPMLLQMQSPRPSTSSTWAMWPPEVKPNFMLNLMKEVTAEESGRNKKKFYVSYPAYDKLTATQLNKVKEFWDNLGEDLKTLLLERGKDASLEDEGANNARQVKTTKDDLCRLLELRIAPEANSLWYKWEHSMPRTVLDARRSTNTPTADGVGTMADEANPLEGLAAIFNNYDDFCPQNKVVEYEDVNGIPTKCIPYKAVGPEYTALAASCWEINPTNIERSTIHRDAAWLKKYWLELKATIAPVLADFMRSGQNKNRDDGDVQWFSDEEAARWIYRCKAKNRRFPDVVSYAYAILDEADFRGLGKNMDIGAGRDHSITGESTGSIDEANTRRKENRQAKRQRISAPPGGTALIAAAMERIASSELRENRLMFLMQHGTTPAIREKAESELLKHLPEAPGDEDTPLDELDADVYAP